jgi:hypothetical protein
MLKVGEDGELYFYNIVYHNTKGILDEARQFDKDGMGYRARRYKIFWNSKTCSWQHFMIEYGIRWSEKYQYFPVWNVSNNSSRALLFGFGLYYLYIIYNRRSSFNQSRKLPFKHRLNKFYKLIS